MPVFRKEVYVEIQQGRDPAEDRKKVDEALGQLSSPSDCQPRRSQGRAQPAIRASVSNIAIVTTTAVTTIDSASSSEAERAGLATALHAADARTLSRRLPQPLPAYDRLLRLLEEGALELRE